GRAFASVAEAIMAFDQGSLELHATVKVLTTAPVPPVGGFEGPGGWEEGQPILFETTLGRALFNETLPVDYPYVNSVVDEKRISAIVNELAERYPKVEFAASLDALNAAGFRWATRSGVTIAISDVATPVAKAEILEQHEERALKVQQQYDRGLITDDERRQELIEIWTQATDKVASVMRENLEANDRNTVYRMVGSGARGNWMQVRQIAGMRGLVANPKGEIIPRPIKSNYREGLSVLEYFIATH